MTTQPELPEIPVIDVGPSFALDTAQQVGERAYDLLSLATARVPDSLLRLLDLASKRWLERNASPYLSEIAHLAGLSRLPGVYYINVHYEWGCTTAARSDAPGQSPILQRTLDWDVAGIGRYVLAARIAGPFGGWINLTWPGFTGVIQAMAPGRFAAAINQPMPRRLSGVMTIDKLLALRDVWRSPHIQPVHLLRRVFETAVNYGAAKEMLATVAITTPAIFTLAGVRPHEACVIERRPVEARILETTLAANDWRTPEWRPRHHLAYQNEARLRAMELASPAWDPELRWVNWPLLNKQTRLALMADPAKGRLLARGYEKERPATRTLRLEI